MSDLSRIRPLERGDCELLADAFAALGWSKPAAQFVGYLEEQDAGERDVAVAVVGGEPAGYVTVLWRSRDPVLAGAGIPEIVDLNVLPRFRGKGIGSALLDHAESVVAERAPRVGLRVGLHAGYGAAQRLYVRRGYLPDGRGALDGSGTPISEGARIALDDDVTLRMTRPLRGA